MWKEVIRRMQLQKDAITLSDADFLRLIEEKGDSFYRVAYGYGPQCGGRQGYRTGGRVQSLCGEGTAEGSGEVLPLVLPDSDPYCRHLPAPACPFRGVGGNPSGGCGHGGGAVGGYHMGPGFLSRLEAKSRTVIVLKVYENMTFPEIAQILKKSENSVKSLYYRGLKSLKERMRVHGG